MAMICSLFKLIITPEFPIYGLQICADFNTENDNKPQNQPQKNNTYHQEVITIDQHYLTPFTKSRFRFHVLNFKFW